jgi:hypothetical protein
MNTRFRFLLIGFGAILVIATYAFPLWYPLIASRGETFPFPELDPTLHEAFNLLPPERQADYLTLRRTNIQLALDMASAALQPDIVIPEEAQALPELSGQQPIIETEFTDISPNRGADGNVTIYELPDGSRYVWISDFNAIKGPDMRVFLSTRNTASLDELEEEDDELTLSSDDFPLGRLNANVGNQRFDIPIEEDLNLYNSIILYSQGLNLIYAIADI